MFVIRLSVYLYDLSVYLPVCQHGHLISVCMHVHRSFEFCHQPICINIPNFLQHLHLENNHYDSNDMHPVPITPMMASAVKGISRLCSKAGVSLYGSTVIREGSISYCCGWEPWLREREILSSWLCWGIKRVSCPMADPFRACTDVLNPL